MGQSRAILIIASLFLTAGGAYAMEPSSAHGAIGLGEIKGLSSLSPWEKKAPVASSQHLRYFEFVLADGTKISLISGECPPRHSKWRLRPFLAATTQPTSASAGQAGADVAVNGGYFNLSDGESASYVTIGGKVVADPTRNDALIKNARLKAFLPQIFNRSELRVMTNSSGEVRYAIASHDAALPTGFITVDALQAGPRLLPNLTAVEEAFIRREADGKETDSIGVKRTAARTAIGLGKDGQFFIVSVAGKKQDEFSAGMTLADLATLLKNLGAVEALNFDGGTSTTQVLRTESGYKMLVGLERETHVKSILCLTEIK